MSCLSKLRWSKKEELNLKSFVIKKQEPLVLNIYKNIIAGALLFRREGKLFVEMSAFVGRTPEQCKSKFQKFEYQVYVEFLKIPLKHFEVFQWLREKKKLTKKIEKRRLKEAEERNAVHEKNRKEIIESISQGNVSFRGITTLIAAD